MSKKNSNLHEAKRAKNDEFYTRFEDVEAELENYQDKFRGKIVYLNCDSEKSAFWRYFTTSKFSDMGLEKVIATHYDPSGGAYKLEYNGVTKTKTPLQGNGDFRSAECMEFLASCDVVVTNPPFSLFRDFVEIVSSLGKDFLVIGSMNAITYKTIFPKIRDNQLWLGVNSVKEFIQPNDENKKFGNICWFTTLSHKKREEDLVLFREYDETFHQFYDNHKVLNIDKVVNIPVNFQEVMAVPISFLSKHNPSQFEIIDYVNGGWKDWTLGGKHKYDRVLIKRK